MCWLNRQTNGWWINQMDWSKDRQTKDRMPGWMHNHPDVQTVQSITGRIEFGQRKEKNNKVRYCAVQRMCQWLNCRADRTQPAASLPRRPAALRVGSLGKHNKHSGQSILCKAMFSSPRRIWISLLICVTVHVRNSVYLSYQYASDIYVHVYVHVCVCVEMYMPTCSMSV